VHYPKTSQHFPYYYCLEKSGGKPNFKEAATKCAKASDMDISVIETCVNGDEGKALQKRYAQLTPSDHKYTPWVELDGTVTKQRGTFISQLCKAYKKAGGTKPAGCPKIDDEQVDAYKPCPV